MPFFNQYKTGYLMSRVIGEVGDSVFDGRLVQFDVVEFVEINLGVAHGGRKRLDADDADATLQCLHRHGQSGDQAGAGHGERNRDAIADAIQQLVPSARAARP